MLFGQLLGPLFLRQWLLRRRQYLYLQQRLEGSTCTTPVCSGGCSGYNGWQRPPAKNVKPITVIAAALELQLSPKREIMPYGCNLSTADEDRHQVLHQRTLRRSSDGALRGGDPFLKPIFDEFDGEGTVGCDGCGCTSTYQYRYICDGSTRRYQRRTCQGDTNGDGVVEWSGWSNQSSESCSFGCSGSTCNADPCAGVSCPDSYYCSSGRYRYRNNRACSGGSCYTASTSYVSDCGTNYWFCSGNTRILKNRGCSGAGSCYSYDSNHTGCTWGCSGSSCNPDPCAGVSCTTPPGAYCSGNTRYYYDSVGSCSGGSCSYTRRSQYCSYGCSGGSCLSDPCAGVSCSGQYYCSGGNRYYRTRYCSGGSCYNNSGSVNQYCGSSGYSCSGYSRKYTSRGCSGSSCYSNVTWTGYCSYGCSGSSCASNPCAGVSCPATYFCSGAYRYRQNRYCSGGSCYNSNTTYMEYCSYGCYAGVCSPPPVIKQTCCCITSEFGPYCHFRQVLRTVSLGYQCEGAIR